MIAPDATIVATPHQLTATVGGDAVVLATAQERYFGVGGGVGSRIWELVQSPVPVRTIVETIVAEFDVDRGRCEADVVAFLDQLRVASLVEIVHEADPAAR